VVVLGAHDECAVEQAVLRLRLQQLRIVRRQVAHNLHPLLLTHAPGCACVWSEIGKGKKKKIPIEKKKKKKRKKSFFCSNFFFVFRMIAGIRASQRTSADFFIFPHARGIVRSAHRTAARVASTRAGPRKARALRPHTASPQAEQRHERKIARA
jgi:hypothetical protein